MAEQSSTSTRSPNDEAFELDLDENESIDEVMEDAVAAVERQEPVAAGAGENGAGGRASVGPDESARRIAELERKIEWENGRYLRTLADFENFRKRAEREKRELRRYALLEPLKPILEVADNMHRALAASGSIEDLKQGLEMTMRHLDEVLRKLGVEPIATIGEPFDPTVHEAVSRRESAEVTEPTVIEEMQKGYRIHDRLLRPAMVIVAMPDAAGATTVESTTEKAVSDASR